MQSFPPMQSSADELPALDSWMFLANLLHDTSSIQANTVNFIIILNQQLCIIH